VTGTLRNRKVRIVLTYYATQNAKGFGMICDKPSSVTFGGYFSCWKPVYGQNIKNATHITAIQNKKRTHVMCLNSKIVIVLTAGHCPWTVPLPETRPT